LLSKSVIESLVFKQWAKIEAVGGGNNERLDRLECSSKIKRGENNQGREDIE